MIWLITIAIVVFLCLLPLGISVTYHEGGFLVSLITGPFRFRLYPGKERKEKNEEKNENKPEKKRSRSSTASQKNGGKLTDFVPLLETVLDLLVDFKRKLVVKNLEFQLTLADSDPCELAIKYGKVWAVASSLVALLEQTFRIQKRNIEVQCDFTASETLVFAQIDLVVGVGSVIYLACRHGIKFLKKYLSIYNQRKGGVQI